MPRKIRVLLLDPWTLVPYYTCRLYGALLQEQVNVTLGSITYDLDPDCFSREGIKNDPGLMDVVGRRRLNPPILRRFLKVMEGVLNLAAWTIRISVKPPDIIHVQQFRLLQAGFPLELWFLAYANLLGIQLVHTVHNLLPHDSGESQRPKFRRVYRMMDALICHSEAVKDKLISEFSIDCTKVSVIPHGPLFQRSSSDGFALDRRRAWLTGSGECLVVCQGFVRPYKGIPFLLDSWVQVEAQNSHARLIIAGTGESAYVEELKHQAARLGLRSVQFEDRFFEVEEMLDLFQAARVLVYPYREITTSGALMTGVVQRKAVVATDLAPFRQLLRNGDNALLVPYGNVEAMARALNRLIGNTEERRRLATAIGQLASQEDPWIGIARETHRCYKSVTDGNAMRSTGDACI